jgi:hypothetical protein
MQRFDNDLKEGSINSDVILGKEGVFKGEGQIQGK